MARAQVSELDLERDDSYTVTSGGERRRRGVTLAHLRERTGSTAGGVMTDPETNADVHIDLTPWADRDPETTIIQLRWYWDDQEAFEEISRASKRDYR